MIWLRIGALFVSFIVVASWAWSGIARPSPAERFPPHVISARTHATRPATGWSGLTAFGADGVAPIEVSWDAGVDSLHALIRGSENYEEIVISPVRDAHAGVIVRLFPADTGALPGDTAAAQFSTPLELRHNGMPVLVIFRLFELSPDARRFTLYQTGLDIVQGDRPELVNDYLHATGGWIGNAFGPGLGEWLGRGDPRQLERPTSRALWSQSV